MDHRLRVVFMGTPEYAVTQLNAIWDTSCELVGIFTKTDSPVGRKQILTPPAAKVWGLEHNVPVFQPEKMKTPETLETVRALRPDLIVSAAFGKILPQELLDIPPLGSLNVHGSYLPKLRGASPVQRSIQMGLSCTGVTLMYMDAGIDTGDIVSQAEVSISAEDTEDTLMRKVADAGALLLSDALHTLVAGGTLPRTAQDHDQATYAAMLRREDGLIDWNKTAWEIDCQLRAFHTWPGAYTYCQGIKLDLTEAVYEPSMETLLAPGTVLPAFLEGKHPVLYIACGNGTVLHVKRLKLAGSAAGSAEDFLRGHPMKNVILGEM